MTNNGNQPAFAAMNEQDIFYGLTKREYFAAMAMQGLMSNSRVIVNDIDNIKQCILIADELLKQLETKTN